MAQPFELKFIVDLAEALGQVKSFAEGMGKVTEAVAAVGQVGQDTASGLDKVTAAATAGAQAVEALTTSVAAATTAEAAEASELARLTELLGSEGVARASMTARIIDMTVAQESATAATAATTRVTAEASASTRSYAEEMSRSAAAAMAEGEAQQTVGNRLNTRLAGLRRLSEEELAARRTQQATSEGITAFTSKTQEIGTLVGVLGLVSPRFFGAAYGLQMLGQAAEMLGPKLVEAGGGVAGFVSVLAPIVAVGAAVAVALGAIAGAAMLVGASLKSAIPEQESETSFAILLGSVEKAKARLEELDATALKFHLDPEQVRGASEQLTRFSQGALGTGDSLNTVIEMSAHTGKSLTEMGAIFGRLYEVVQSGQPIARMGTELVRLGLLSASDVNHLNNLHKEGAKGPEVWAAAEAALNKYGGAAEARANTFQGAVRGIKAAWEEILEVFGRPIVDVLTPLLQSIGGLLTSLVPTAKAAADQIKAAVQTIYGLVENGTLAERFELSIDLAVDKAALHFIGEFKNAWNEIKNFIAQTPIDMAKSVGDALVTPVERQTLGKFVQGVGSGMRRAMANEGGVADEGDDPLPKPDAPAHAPQPALSFSDNLRNDISAREQRQAELDRQARERAQKDFPAPNDGAQFTSMTPGEMVEPDPKKSRVAGRTKEVDEGSEAEKRYKMLLDVTKGALDDGEISQATATAQNIQTTKNYIADLVQLQSHLSPTSDKYAEMEVRIKAARASLLRLAEGQEEYQAALDATKAKLDVGDISQQQADAQDNRTINNYIARLRALQATLDPTSAKFHELETSADKARLALQKTTTLGKVTAMFHRVVTEWGDLGKNASQWLNTSMNSGIATVSQGLTGLITKTGDWRQTFNSAINSMLEGLIELGVKTVLHYAMMGAMMIAHAATGEATTASVTATQVAAGAAIAVAHAPAAAATSVSSYGVSAIVGAVLAIAAIGAIIALLAGGFAEGGLIPGGPSNQDNRIARVATGEYIVRTAAVQHYGVGLLEAINGMGFPLQMPAFAAGGLVGGGAALLLGDLGSRDRGRTAPTVNVGGAKVTLIQPNTRAAMLDALRSAEGDVAILDSVHRQKHRMPFKK